jgi:hypothetical protein
VRAGLLAALRPIADERAIALYLAHLCHRQVEWSIRHHHAATVDYWLGAAVGALDQLGV